MEGNLHSISELARLTGRDRRTVTDRLRDVPADGRLATRPAWRLQTALPAIFQRDELDGARLDAEQERARLFRAQREKVEHENRVRAGEYVSVAEVKAVDAVLYTALRDRILAVPQACGALVVQAALQGGEIEVRQVLRQHLEEALNGFGGEEILAGPG